MADFQDFPLQAIKDESIEEVRALFREDTPPMSTELLDAALLLAIVKKSAEISEILVSNGADVNKSYRRGDSSFELAIRSCDTDIGQAIKSYIFYGNPSPLHIAIILGHANIVNYLLQQGAKTENRYRGRTALHLAVENERNSIVQILLDHGADINSQENEDINSIYSGRTALHFAAENQNEEILKLLLRRNADINMGDNDNFTALHIAAFNNYLKIAIILMNHGANVEAVSKKDEWRPLHCAASKGYTLLVRILLLGKADINAKKSYGDTPLHWAIWKGQNETAKVLIDLGADLDACNVYGDAALAKAKKTNNQEIVDYINQKIRQNYIL